MKKTFSFRPSAKIACAVIVASIFTLSCEKQTSSPGPPGNPVSSHDASAAFNSKAKIGERDSDPTNFPITNTTKDSTKTSTP